MKTPSTNKPRWEIVANFLLPIAIALVFLAFIFSYYPFREKLQFDTDEGLNLMRSMLVARGYPLYSEVSSDQPPLFNHLLALVFQIVGFEVNPARLFVLLFSTLLVWACAQFLQLTWGKLSVILFLPLVIMVPEYLRLSTSVMIGVPSIALAAVSMLLITLWHQKRNSLWLALSGFALALSVLIKLFTGFLVPIFLIGMTISAYLERREEGLSWSALRPAIVWSICFVGLASLLGLVLIGPQNLWSIIFPHMAAPTTESLEGASYTINVRLQAAVPLLFLGFLGALISIYRRNWLALYPLVWATTAYMLFSFYSPVFYHHQLLITIPVTIMAAAAIGDGIASLVRLRQSSDLIRPQTLFGAITVLSFVLVAINYFPGLDRELMNSPRFTDISLRATAGKLKVIDRMNEYADRTNWIMTDMPMYAFRVHRPVPPRVATFSSKRLATGSLTEADILQTMREYQPEQVLMARFVIPGLEDYLEENYTLILSAEFFRLFIRNDLNPVTK
jgi:4-amino-4-deoxy-L-arabinose transferase-like glycosyltransferase